MWLPLVTVLALQAPSPSVAGADRFVTSAGLRMRAAARADADVVHKIPIGSTLTCLERSAPVDVGGTRGPFCRVRVGDKEGWVFEPLTEARAADRVAQEERLILAKMGERMDDDRSRWPDLYELHRWTLTRADAAGDRAAKMRARYLEMRLVASAPEAFFADKRIYRDEAQGLRMSLDAVRAFEREAAGTPSAEDAAWLVVSLGKPFECEGYMPCVLGATADIECGYLASYPRGAHVGEALGLIHDRLSWAADFVSESDMPPDDARDDLAEIERCLHQVPQKQGARALTQAARLLEALRKKESAAAPPAPAGD